MLVSLKMIVGLVRGRYTVNRCQRGVVGSPSDSQSVSREFKPY